MGMEVSNSNPTDWTVVPAASAGGSAISIMKAIKMVRKWQASFAEYSNNPRPAARTHTHTHTHREREGETERYRARDREREIFTHTYTYTRTHSKGRER